MKKILLFIIAFSLLFLLFIQMAGTLVESIYILDLINTSLDAKALGVLFFFTPIVLIFFRKRIPPLLVWIIFSLLFLSRGITPYLDTLGRMLASGLATGSALLLFPLLSSANPKGRSLPRVGLWISAGLALAVGLSILLRTLNYSLDYSLTPAGGWVGWVLGALFGVLLTRLDWEREPTSQEKKRGLLGALLGVFLILTLVYFIFSAPAVLARWTEGSYALIVIAVSLLALCWAWFSVRTPRLLERLTPPMVALWNLAFTLSLLGTILAHRVPFPPTSQSAPVVVGAPTWLQQVPLVLTLLLFPVLFLDLGIFIGRIRERNPSPRSLVPGMLLGSLALVVLVFVNIFTNVWGYIRPVSAVFRNMFWLPYLLLALLITLLVGIVRRREPGSLQGSGRVRWGWTFLLGLVFLGSVIGALLTGRVRPASTQSSSLLVMTTNAHAGTDENGELAYDHQLANFRQVAPDVLALQETDTARISNNNNDYARYFASKLGYYSYYGPTTVTGTFGTALLSRYPLLNPRTVFTYSDKDEIGTTEAEIIVDGRTFNIYNVHPDGSDTAMLVWAQTFLERSQGQSNVIALGDYNLRDYEEVYQLIDAVYTNAWVSIYPAKISTDGTDMSGENRIDHIFVSPSLGVRDPVYMLPPASATDHAIHWAEIFWEE